MVEPPRFSKWSGYPFLAKLSDDLPCRDQWAEPGKDNALTWWAVEKVWENFKTNLVQGEEVKRRPRECRGWTVAGDRSQQEGGDSSTVVTVTVHTFLHLTLCGTLLPPEVCHCVTPLCDIVATTPALHTTTLRQWQRERSLVWPRDASGSVWEL